ncbi:MAG: Zn-dependent protease [Planctomycetota bacterium]
MRNTIPLGKLFGIQIGLNRFTPWLIFLFAVFNGNGDPGLVALNCLLIAGVFFIVLLHELGHSLVAKHFGIRVSRINLWPLGGVAWMEEIPEDSKIEGLIAVAGPAVNLVLALFASPFLLIPAAAPLAAAFIQVNLMLGIFNLVPAFPMDGGRVLRALLALKYDWMEATEKAVRIGRNVAIAGAFISVVYGNFWIPLIVLYIIGAGQRELFAMRARKLGKGFPLGAFAEAARRAQAAGAAGGNPFGFSSAQGFGSAAEPFNDQEPSQNEGEAVLPKHAGRGFSEEDIAKLENARGPLRRDWRKDD